MFRPLAFAQVRLTHRPLLTFSVLSQILPGDRIHSCHQGAGPTLASDDGARAEAILVRSPSPEACVGQRATCFSALLCLPEP